MLLSDLLAGGKALTHHSNSLRLGRFQLFSNMFLDFFARPVQNHFLFDSCGSFALTHSAMDFWKKITTSNTQVGAQADLHDRWIASQSSCRHRVHAGHSRGGTYWKWFLAVPFMMFHEVSWCFMTFFDLCFKCNHDLNDHQVVAYWELSSMFLENQSTV